MCAHGLSKTTRVAVFAGAIIVATACEDGAALTAPLLGDQPSLAGGPVGGAGGGGAGSVVKSIVGLEPLLNATQNISFALKVSDVGQVVGTSATNSIGSIVQHAVIWDASTFAQDLGTLNGAAASEATAILPNGSVIIGGSNSRAVRWVTVMGVWTIDALPNPTGATSCGAVDIASDGTIIGSCVVGGLAHVTTWRNGIATDWGQGVGVAINRNGQMVVHLIGGQAVLWDTRTNPVTVTQLGSLGGTATFAQDMNDFGDVVGNSQNAAVEFRPFLWTAKKGMVELNTLAGGTSGRAEAINNAGQIVGSTFDGTLNRATYWFRGKPYDLGVLPAYEGSTAQSLNATGQIVGYSYVEDAGLLTDIRATLWNLKSP